VSAIMGWVGGLDSNGEPLSRGRFRIGHKEWKTTDISRPQNDLSRDEGSNVNVGMGTRQTIQNPRDSDQWHQRDPTLAT